eukprot:5287738-Heterocapsa_arctica.AAC.1
MRASTALRPAAASAWHSLLSHAAAACRCLCGPEAVAPRSTRARSPRGSATAQTARLKPGNPGSAAPSP